jgi:hypothetical protein
MVDIGLMLVGRDECKLMPMRRRGYPSLAVEFDFFRPTEATESTENADTARKKGCLDKGEIWPHTPPIAFQWPSAYSVFSVANLSEF